MLNSELRAVEGVLASVAATRKFVQFYPPNNSNVAHSLDDLVAALGRIFATGKDRGLERSVYFSEESNTPIAPDGLLLDVHRDVFVYADEEVGADNLAVRKLASDIYRLGVKRIQFLPRMNSEQLRGFFELICHSSDEIEAMGGMAKALERYGVTEVTLGLAQDLSLVDRDELPEELDLVSYLRSKQAFRMVSAGDEDYDFPEDEYDDAAEISDFFLDIAKGSQEKRRYLFNTLTNSGRLAEALTLISQSDPKRYDESDYVSDGILREGLHAMAAVIDTFSDETRDAFVRNMSEGILSTDPRTRELVLSSPLAAEVGCGGVEDAILAALPNDEIVETLAHHVRFHNGTASTISNFLEEFNADPDRKGALVRMFARTAAAADEDHVRAVAHLLDTELEKAAAGADARPELKPVIPLAQREALNRKLLLDEDALKAAETAVAADFVSATNDHAARTLFELIAHTGDDGAAPQLVENFYDTLKSALDGEHYDFLAELLTIAVDELPGDAQARMRVPITRILGECAYPKHVDKIVTILRKRDKTSPEYAELLYLIALLGDLAAEHIFLRLEMEPQRATRMYLLSLCVDLGEAMLGTLRKKVNHRDWFVARNVVYVLGKIGSDSAVESLARLVDHRDARVQREVLRALAAIRGDRAEQVLISCLDHEDAIVRRLAAEWLGQMRSPRALDILIARIDCGRRALLRDTHFAIGVVRALGLLGNEEHIPLVKKLTPRSPRLGSGPKRELADACAEAVLRLKGESTVAIMQRAASQKRKLWT